MKPECKCHGVSGKLYFHHFKFNFNSTFTSLPPSNLLTNVTKTNLIVIVSSILLGACTIQTCWLKLPAFREVASKLHDSLHQAIKVAPVKQKSLTSTSTKVKRRPVARSISDSISSIERIISPGEFDLLYLEESPDFCVNNDRYNIKGTEGRTCSESQNAINSCEGLCCGRGYKTEVREEKHKCECQFKFCCQLDCKTCTGRKVVHKCL